MNYAKCFETFDAMRDCPQCPVDGRYCDCSRETCKSCWTFRYWADCNFEEELPSPKEEWKRYYRYMRLARQDGVEIGKIVNGRYIYVRNGYFCFRKKGTFHGRECNMEYFLNENNRDFRWLHEEKNYFAMLKALDT